MQVHGTEKIGVAVAVGRAEDDEYRRRWAQLELRSPARLVLVIAILAALYLVTRNC